MRVSSRWCGRFLFLTVAGALGGVPLSASAARDIVWEGTESSAWSGRNWYIFSGGETWVAGNNAVFTNAVSGGVTVDADVSAVQVRVENASVAFAGTGILSLSGPFAVGAGLTATVDNPIGSEGNFQKSGEGTLTVRGTETSENTLNRLNVLGGTLRLSGGTYTLTATDTGASGSVVPFHGNGGRLIVDGGAKVVTTGSGGFAANSGTEMIVTNAVVDFWSRKEYLHGMQDFYGTSQSTNSSLTLQDGGTFIAKQYRLGKVTKAKRAALGEQYALTTLEKGGRLVVNSFSMDGANARSDYTAGLDFNGGTLVITNIEAKKSLSCMVNSGNWTNVTVRVREGGARIQLAGPQQYQTFGHPIVSGADGEDGGVTIVGGDGFLYMSGKNGFTGGTHLRGTIYIPSGGDSSFGAVPAEPKPNIFFDTSTPTLHMENIAVHSNRTVWIGTNVMAKIGVQNNTTARLAGEIRGAGDDGHLGSLTLVNSWGGCLAIGPTGDRTNRIGRLFVNGHLRHVAGTTLVTSNTHQKTGSDTHFQLCGNGTAYAETKGTLDIAGGLVKITCGSWIESVGYGQLIVTNGTFDCSATTEYLNALGTAGRVIVGGNGTFIGNRLRISQCNAKAEDGSPRAYVHLKTGGVLKVNTFWLDSTQKSATGSVLLDGGTLMPRKSTVDFLGETDTAVRAAAWNDRIFVRACAGGAVIDTDGWDVTVKNPILSGAEADGGVVKMGLGTLTLANTNTYNGVTRVDGGQLVFSHASGFPGGDIEVSARALKDNPRTGALIRVASLAFRSGAKVLVVDTDGLTPETFGRRVTLVEAENPIAAVPEVVGPTGWNVRLSDDGRKLTFGAERGLCILVK